MPDHSYPRRPPQPQPRAECATSDTLAIDNVDELWRAALRSARTLSAISFAASRRSAVTIRARGAINFGRAADRSA